MYVGRNIAIERWGVLKQNQERGIVELGVLFGSEDEMGRGGQVKYYVLMSFQPLI